MAYAGNSDGAGLFPPGVRNFLQRRAIEIAGLVVTGLAITLGIALAAYHPTDPSWSFAGGQPVQNLLGAAGATFSDLGYQTLGLAAFAFCFLTAIWGWRLVSHALPRWSALRVGLFPLAVLLPAGVLAIFAGSEPESLPAGPGGVLGKLIHAQAIALGDITGLPIGGWLGLALMTICALAAVIFVAGIPLGQIVRIVLRIAPGIAALTARIIDARPRWPRREEAPVNARVEPLMDEAVAISPRKSRRVAPAAPPALQKAPAKKKTRRKKEPQPALNLEGGSDFALPPLALLQEPEHRARPPELSNAALGEKARVLESVLDDFGVRGEIKGWSPGPVVTLFELDPAPGLKTSRVVGLADDVARSMSAISTRVARIAGEKTIGIELPNPRRETVYLRELFAERDYEDASYRLALALGKTIGGEPVIADLARMPHLLIAGTTGSGKSVAINTMILSLIYRLPPEQCRLIMIDPKMLELSVYEGIPHLLAPVVTDPRKAVVALKWVVKEMEDRYRKMSKLGVRNIAGYNQRMVEALTNGEMIEREIQTGVDEETGQFTYEIEELEPEQLPFIVVIIDEMADLMMVAGKEIEGAVQRLAQMARAAGIHVIMATQRPSVDVITGTIKANFPTRISFQVTSKIDSRTILGEQGAEQLLGMGDMLYMAGGGRVGRVHGPFVSDEEVEEVVDFLKRQGPPDYLSSVTESDIDDDDGADGGMAGGNSNSGDAMFDAAVDVVTHARRVSTSYIQRKLQIGYNRAARIVEEMEDQGIISGPNHQGKREVLTRDPNE